ncbi:hypothetical protein OROGR_025117 [Orobanche gracilis]
MMATSSGSRGREGSAKSAVADQISQSVQSTSNILHLMLQSSPSHSQLMKLPRNLLSKTSTIKNTEMILEKLPQVISALDEHVESGLQRSGLVVFACLLVLDPDFKLKSCSAPHLNTVVQLLSKMQTSQLKSLSAAELTQPGRREG